MPKAVEFNLESRQIRDIALDDVVNDGPKEVIYWLHLELDGDFEEHARRYGISEDHLKEIAAAGNQPEMSDGVDGLLLVLPYWSPGDGEGAQSRLVIHLSETHCLTASDRELPAIRDFDRSYRVEFRYAQSPGFILFLVLEFLIEDFADMVNRLDEEGQSFDERIHGGADASLNRDILALKRRVLTLKRVVGHARAIIGRIAGRRIAVITEACRESLGDVGNEAQAVLTSVESLRDMVDSAFDSYRSELAQRLNEIMKVLTMVSLAILPMTLIAGVYGMNFKSMPELNWYLGYPMAILLMLLSATGILVFFKRRGWM